MGRMFGLGVGVLIDLTWFGLCENGGDSKVLERFRIKETKK